MIKLNILYFVCIFTFVLLGIFASNSRAAEAICQSEVECRELCEEYQQALNNDDSVEWIYDCNITGFTEVQTIEADGTTNSNTEFNCLCFTTGMKEGDGDGSDGGGDGIKVPPVILNPLIPDFPGGILPPDNGLVDCINKARKWASPQFRGCNDRFNELLPPNKQLGKFDWKVCRENVDDALAEKIKKCHKKWSKKAIRKIDPLIITE